MTPPTVECPECSLWECSCPEDDQPCVYYSKCSTCGGTGEVERGYNCPMHGEMPDGEGECLKC